MKLILRRFYAVPFIIVAFLTLAVKNPDNNCYGLADLMLDIIWYGLIVLTGVFAIVGCFRQHKTGNLKIEPITLLVITIAILAIVYNFTLRGHSHGEIWIFAESKKSKSSTSSYGILLRKNNNFTITNHYLDFGCSFSGQYQKHGDTIKLNQEIVDKGDERFTATYLLKENYLIPLIDTTNKFHFKITEIN